MDTVSTRQKWLTNHVISQQTVEKLQLKSSVMREPNLKSHDDFELCTLDDAIKRADIVLLLVDHKSFKKCKASDLSEKVVIDTRGVVK